MNFWFCLNWFVIPFMSYSSLKSKNPIFFVFWIVMNIKSFFPLKWEKVLDNDG